MRVFFLLFILVPIAELFLLIEVGTHIGALPTILLVLLTAVVGLVTLRSQGFLTMLRARQRMMQGELPGREILEGFLIAIGGIMLMVPGFITDATGLLLLLPWTRRMLISRMFIKGNVRAWGNTAGGSPFFRSGKAGRPDQPADADIFEGEFTRDPGSRKSLETPDRDKNPP